MGHFKSIEEAREYFKNDLFAMQAGVQLDEMWEGGCICSMPV